MDKKDKSTVSSASEKRDFDKQRHNKTRQSNLTHKHLKWYDLEEQS